MNSIEYKQKIKSSILNFNQGEISTNSINLLNVLCYKSNKTLKLSPNNFVGLNQIFNISNTSFSKEKAIVEDWLSIDVLFQLSKDDITDTVSLFDTAKVDHQIIESYLFFALELSKTDYSRSDLVKITREINKLTAMPSMIIFKYGEYLTLSVIDRRLHKRDESKDVLEKVTLIKDINISNPHRAHIEILFDLSIFELSRIFSFSNFVELHNAWRKTLDTKELNKKFFQELANWYFWAMANVHFPADLKLSDDKKKDEELRNATNIIRLITRVIFIWFIREKNLVPDVLFRKEVLNNIVKDFFKNQNAHNYYHAILQNLFFGTLNQKMNERGFAKEGNFENNKNEYGVKNLFRYVDKFALKEKEVVELFKDIPFLNGGLFDCLDKPNEKDKIVYVDGFSRNPKKQAVVPDFLFFTEKEKDVDLTNYYNPNAKKPIIKKVKGLFEIFNNYKFTVEENTPIEEEIALDPELLGKVFENLLAYYNPETQTTARKQTGSFYTPREIVNYMVDESLIAYLKQALSICHSEPVSPTGRLVSESDEMLKQVQHDEEWLRDLLSYSENPNPFNETETKVLIEAINKCKILDPACGTGAFPVGMLHKLVHILHKLDKDNKQWKELQYKKAIAETEETFTIGNKEEREKRLLEINEVFDQNVNDPDYARKLYLIENCIYGVDIQPIAVQIAKLRFFISLIIDQKKTTAKENFGIRSLPNLETKFVAANTLIGLEKPAQTFLRNPEIEKKENQLKELRHNYFTAKTRKEKLQYQSHDKKLRKEIAKLLEDDGWNTTVAKQIVAFDPYDQNSSATFFDPEWMFGLKPEEPGEGVFDIVIGNPPYGADLNENEKILLEKEFNKYKTLTKNSAIYFIYKSNKQLKNNGVNSFIIPKSICYSNGWNKCADFIISNGLYKLIDCGKAFENVKLEMVIFIMQKELKTVSFVNGRYIDGKIEEYDKINKSFFYENKVLLAGQSKPELELLLKLNQRLKSKWGDYFVTERGLNWQTKAQKYRGKISIYRGSQLNKWFLSEPTDFINLTKFSKDEYAYQLKPKILNQLAIAHVMNPYPHFYLQSTYAGENTLVYETISCSFNKSSEIALKLGLAINNSKLFAWLVYKFIYSNAIRSTRYDDMYISRVPTPNFYNIDQKPFLIIVDYLLLINAVDPRRDSFFERLIDAMVYELYFPEEIKAAGCEVLKHLTNLPELKDEWSNDKKLKTIEKVYKELSNPSHPVSIAMARMREIEEIKIIEWQ